MKFSLVVDLRTMNLGITDIISIKDEQTTRHLRYYTLKFERSVYFTNFKNHSLINKCKLTKLREVGNFPKTGFRPGVLQQNHKGKIHEKMAMYNLRVHL